MSDTLTKEVKKVSPELLPTKKDDPNGVKKRIVEQIMAEITQEGMPQNNLLFSKTFHAQYLKVR